MPKQSSEYLGFWWPPLGLIVYLLLAYGVYVNFTALPNALSYEDEILNPDRFIAERAANVNAHLTNLGPKVLGSPTNQITAIDFLLDQIRQIVADSDSAHLIEYEVQTAEKGIFQINSINSYYQNIDNVVVRLSPSANGGTPISALLINSHFDSVPSSPGGSDDSFMVANMLEILRVLSGSDQTHEHAIIFLFNGAEEMGLQGSHPFITQHPWASDVRAFINLDAAGSGGKECLFQVTPGHSWLMKYYKEHAPHPFASAWMEELFRANLIPSDTDFRIFRDFGHVAGVDLAIASNGYVYHTRFDRAEIIPEASYQNTGDNILALTKALANAAELNNLGVADAEEVVFFDYLGFFMISYFKTEGIIINCMVSLVNLIGIGVSFRLFAVKSKTTHCQLWVEFSLIFVVQVVSILIGVGLVLALAVVYDALYHSMSWFSNQWLTVGLYMCPLFVVLGLGPAMYLKVCRIRASGWERLKEEANINLILRGTLIQMFLHSHAVILIILCLTMTGLGIRSAYILTIGLVFHGASTWLNLFTKLYSTGLHWIWLHILGQLIPFLFYANFFVSLMVIFIPIQGRMGSSANPEILLSVLVTCAGLLIAGLLIPIITLVKRPIITVTSLFGALWLISVACMFSPIGFPYRAETSVQRYGIYHTERTIQDINNTVLLRDHGFLVIGNDRHVNLHLEDLVSLEYAIPASSFCEKYAFCGLPVSIPDSLWLLAGPTAVVSEKPELKLLRQTRPSTDTKQYDFELTGPDHMNILISTPLGATLSNWTLGADILTTAPQSGRMLIGSGKMVTPMQFSISVETADSDQVASLDIAVVGNYVHHDSDRTPEFQQFVDSFPEWVHVTALMISYESWQY